MKKNKEVVTCKCQSCGLVQLWSKPSKPCASHKHGMHDWKRINDDGEFQTASELSKVEK